MVENGYYACLTFDEGEQVGIHLVLMGRAHAVGSAVVHFQFHVWDQLDRAQGGSFDGHDLVIAAMKEESWDIELFEIFSKICLGEGFDAVEDSLKSCLHPQKPERVAQSL